MGIKLVGDYAVRTDNKPLGENVGGFLHKTMRIAGSGIYRYHRSEAELFGLDPSKLPGDQMFFNIYRPPEVLKKHKDMFARVPLITGRHVQVTLENAKELAVGWVGDTVDVEMDKEDGELYLYTTGTIVAGDGVRAYEESGQLSVGYVPSAHWESGVHKGEKYDAVLDSFRDVNHILLCKEARGGPQIMVMDSLDSLSPLEKFIESRGGTKVGILSKIFGSQKAAMVGDARVPVLLQSIAVGADPKTQVDTIKALVGDAKTDVQKEFHSFLDELAQCKEEAPETKARAVEIVSKFYTEKVAGDSSDGAPDKDKGEGVDDKAKSGSAGKAEETDDKAAGDETPEEKEAREKKEADDKAAKDKASAGDSNAAVLEAVKALAAEVAELKKPKVAAVVGNEQAVDSMRVLVGGDSAPDKKVSSDAFIKSIL